MKILKSRHTALLLVDAQEKLMQVMGDRQRTAANIHKLLELAQLFNLPIIVTEQYPKMLGPTLPELQSSLPTYAPIEKLHFNCCAVEAFNAQLDAFDLQNIILTGAESHICVFQTCVSLVNKGYAVQVPQDAVDSRTKENRQAGLNLMQQAGAIITSTETIIYQILEKAGTPAFKTMLKLVK